MIQNLPILRHTRRQPREKRLQLEIRAGVRHIPSMVKIDMEAIKRLSVTERVRLAQDIWETLQPTAQELPLTKAQVDVLDRRLEEHQQDPSSAIPWDEVKARLESE